MLYLSPVKLLIIVNLLISELRVIVSPKLITDFNAFFI